MSEGRQGSPTFSIRTYRFLYGDLRAAYGNDLKAYYMHYIQSGQKEGRLAVGYDYMAPDLSSNAAGTNGTANAAGTGSSNAASAGASDPAEAVARQKAAAIADALGRDIHACLNWSAAMPYERNNSFDSTKTAAFLANYGFDNRKGNCGVMAATFYEMAKYLGYDAHQVWGVVPLRGGGMGMHSWVEIVIDGQTYVCDPDFQNETKKSGYMLRYKQRGTWRYTDYHRVN